MNHLTQLNPGVDAALERLHAAVHGLPDPFGPSPEVERAFAVLADEGKRRGLQPGESPAHWRARLDRPQSRRAKAALRVLQNARNRHKTD
ncbi:MAG TPA: hypothetical protein PKN23_09655 [Candidatus Hydrogenedentes bacterium]|nr:hypothetical protein [Candidatus Hydrogenedentota bacterium]HOH51293.1 hypothetical protein [Candidatus Hydrogenedentota bacterium]